MSRQILDERIDSSGAASRAFFEILRRCDRAGETACAFAAGEQVTALVAEVRDALDGDTAALSARLRTAGDPPYDNSHEQSSASSAPTAASTPGPPNGRPP